MLWCILEICILHYIQKNVLFFYIRSFFRDSSMFFIPLFNIKYSILVQNVKSKIYWRLLITDNISKSQSAASFICGVISFLATLVWYACYFLWIYGLFCLGDIFLMNNKLELWLKAVEVQNKMSHFLERLQIQEKIGSMWPAVKLGVFFLLCFKSYRWKNLKELISSRGLCRERIWGKSFIFNKIN